MRTMATRGPWPVKGWLFAAGVGIGLATLSVALYQHTTQPPPRPQILSAYANRPRLIGPAVVLMRIQTRGGIGSIKIRLEGDSAPITAGHFLDLVTRGFYNGLRFHRVEKDPEPFIVQGGEPQDRGIQTPVLTQLRGIPLEIQVQGEPQPRYNELIDVTTSGVSLALPHETGVIAMSRSLALDSAASQFYITLASLPILDGRYAVFGKVIEGLNWVDQIQVGDTIVSAEVLEGLDHLIYPQPTP